jgi:hypothetical protein
LHHLFAKVGQVLGQSCKIDYCIENKTAGKGDSFALDTQSATNFDFSLMRHFIFFKKECPKLSITIILQRNYETKGSKSSNILWKLRQ